MQKQQQQGDFQAVWGYPNEVLNTIKEATRYEVHPAPPRSSGGAATYKSGRPRYLATFYKDDTVLTTRLAMRLTSKNSGVVYDVCLRNAM